MAFGRSTTGASTTALAPNRDALRADMRVLLDEVRKLIHEADRRVSDAERARGADRGDPDDAW
jgi:hypothetical protein